MKIALCVFPVQTRISEALVCMTGYISQAASLQCELILFPEACFGGLDEISGNYETDSSFGLGIESPELESLRETARKAHIHIAFGWLEQTTRGMYDSALVIDDKGIDILHYRRISPGWLSPEIDSKSYHCGTEITFADTKLGRIAFLICGDLFTPGLPEKIAGMKPNLVLYPFARAILHKNDPQSTWDEFTMPEYLTQWKKCGGTILATNTVERVGLADKDAYCGGAWLVHPQAGVLAAKTLMEEGLMICVSDSGRINSRV